MTEEEITEVFKRVSSGNTDSKVPTETINRIK